MATRPDLASAPVVPVVSDVGASTTASEQYMAWYTRASTGTTATAAPGMGTAPDMDATTTAGEQYLGWYTRGSRDSSRWTSTTDYYRSWYLRDAGDQ